MGELNGTKRLYWRIGIVVGCIVIFGFMAEKVFVTRSDYNSHMAWAEQRNEVLIELLKNQKTIMDSISVINRKLDKIDNRLNGY